MTFNLPKIKLATKFRNKSKLKEEYPSNVKSESVRKNNSIQNLTNSSQWNNYNELKKQYSSKNYLKDLFNNNFLLDNETTISNEISSLRSKHINTQEG